MITSETDNYISPGLISMPPGMPATGPPTGPCK